MPARSSGSVKVFYPRYRRDELIALLRKGAEVLGKKLPLKLVMLFGSQATGRATAFSDVDVLVVYAGPLRTDAYELVRRSFGISGLEAHVYTEEEAASNPVIERMVRGGIKVYEGGRERLEALRVKPHGR